MTARGYRCRNLEVAWDEFFNGIGLAEGGKCATLNGLGAQDAARFSPDSTSDDRGRLKFYGTNCAATGASTSSSRLAARKLRLKWVSSFDDREFLRLRVECLRGNHRRGAEDEHLRLPPFTVGSTAEFLGKYPLEESHVELNPATSTSILGIHTHICIYTYGGVYFIHLLIVPTKPYIYIHTYTYKHISATALSAFGVTGLVNFAFRLLLSHGICGSL